VKDRVLVLEGSPAAIRMPYTSLIRSWCLDLSIYLFIRRDRSGSDLQNLMERLLGFER